MPRGLQQSGFLQERSPPAQALAGTVCVAIGEVLARPDDAEAYRAGGAVAVGEVFQARLGQHSSCYGRGSSPIEGVASFEDPPSLSASTGSSGRVRKAAQPVARLRDGRSAVEAFAICHSAAMEIRHHSRHKPNADELPRPTPRLFAAKSLQHRVGAVNWTWGHLIAIQRIRRPAPQASVRGCRP